MYEVVEGDLCCFFPYKKIYKLVIKIYCSDLVLSDHLQRAENTANHMKGKIHLEVTQFTAYTDIT